VQVLVVQLLSFIISSIQTKNLNLFFDLFSLFNYSKCSSVHMASSRTVISEYWIGKRGEVSGRGLTWGIIPQLTWRNWRKQRKLSVTLASQNRILKSDAEAVSSRMGQAF